MRLFSTRKKNKDIKQKIDDIMEQIDYLNSTKLHTVRSIGRSDHWDYLSPKDLINLQWKRVHTLQRAMKQSKSEIENDHNRYYNLLCTDCKHLYTDHNIGNIPCSPDYDGYCQIVLLGEILNGLR